MSRWQNIQRENYQVHYQANNMTSLWGSCQSKNPIKIALTVRCRRARHASPRHRPRSRSWECFIQLFPSICKPQRLKPYYCKSLLQFQFHGSAVCLVQPVAGGGKCTLLSLLLRSSWVNYICVSENLCT